MSNKTQSWTAQCLTGALSKITQNTVAVTGIPESVSWRPGRLPRSAIPIVGCGPLCAYAEYLQCRIRVMRAAVRA